MAKNLGRWGDEQVRARLAVPSLCRVKVLAKRLIGGGPRVDPRLAETA
jgi:hypothetical protein